jgi:hypothetical protein
MPMATGAKAAIVTGAASGLGRAVALGLADNGIDVVAVDQNASALAALATAMTGRRGSVLTHQADLAQPDAFERMRIDNMNALRRSGAPGLGPVTVTEPARLGRWPPQEPMPQCTLSTRRRRLDRAPVRGIKSLLPALRD